MPGPEPFVRAPVLADVVKHDGLQRIARTGGVRLLREECGNGEEIDKRRNLLKRVPGFA